MEPLKDKREIKSDITCTSLFSGNVVAGHHDSHHHHHLPGLPRQQLEQDSCCALSLPRTAQRTVWENQHITVRSCLALPVESRRLSQPQVLVLVFLVMARYPLLGCCSRLWFASSQAMKSGNFLLNMNRCQGGRLTPGGACVCAGEGCLPSGS